MYVCGAKKVADGVLGALRPVLLDAERRNGRLASGLGKNEAWAELVSCGRYLVEVFL